MIKICRCGAEYDAGVGPFFLPVCSKCATEWDVEVEARMFKPEAVEIPEDEFLDSLGIRPRHYHCTFDNFAPRDDNETKALEVCKRMAESWRGLVALIGNNGTGKTHLASATVRAVGAGKYYKMLEVGMFIRRAFDKELRLDEQGQLDALIGLPFLAIDEVEKSKRTENEINWLSYLVDERLERNRATMILGNCHPKTIHKDGAFCDKCFESIMTPDVLDRISQYGVMRYFDGPSHRPELRGKE